MLPRIVIGVINDVLPAAYSYTVDVPHVAVPVQCAGLSSATNSLGARSFSLFEPGTTVLCYIWADPGRYPTGVVLGALPLKGHVPQIVISDWIAPFTDTHALSDEIGRHIALTHSKGIYPHTTGTPLDVIPGHDVGVMQDLGLGYGVGYLETWLRASDVSGIWCYHQDNLTRLAAYNFDFWHAGGERWIRNEQGEINDIDTMSAYPWEALGLWVPGDNAYKVNSGEGNYKVAGGKLKYEPKEFDQTGIVRHRKYRGYIADISRSDTILPKLASGTSTDRVHKLTAAEEHNFSGLLTVKEHIDGRYSVRSSKGITLEKYLFLPVPRQIALPEEGYQRGDTAFKNYAPAGKGAGAGSANEALHKRTGIMLPDDHSRVDMWIGQLFDIHAYVYNWFSVRGITAHEFDWTLPEEGHFAHQERTAGSWFGGVYIPDARLADTYTFPIPKFFDVAVDHHTNSRYYCSRSIIDQLEDGSIVIEDGYGSSIQLTGGNIHLTCAGDFFVRTGRSSITWAGDDIIERAGSSIDISAALGDLRLKSERNLHAVAGNGSLGGVLIQSLSKPVVRERSWLESRQGEEALTNGIVFSVTEGSPLLFKAADLRFVAEGDSSNDGTMIFEATGGMEFLAKFHSRTTTNDAFGFVDKSSSRGVIQAYNHTNYVNLSSSAAFSSERVGFKNDIFVGNRVNAASGVVPYGNAGSVASSIVSSGTRWINNVGGNVGVSDYFDGARVRTEWLIPAYFTFRTTEEYGTAMSSFYVVEARWQRAYRERQIGVGFMEPEVNYTLPHPGGGSGVWGWGGQGVWEGQTRYRVVDSKLFDWQDKKSVDRGEPNSAPYGDGTGSPEIAKLRQVTFASNYLVSKQEVSTSIS